jgi:hypothetical protein
MVMPFALSALFGFPLLFSLLSFSEWLMCQTRLEREQEKANVRRQFSKNFRDLQVISQRLLNSHIAGTLTPTQLSKEVKAINKSAKTLRELMALGQLAEQPDKINEELTAAAEFDQAIKQLAKIIYDFSHSPHHQNNKVFDMAEATKIQKELLTIIHLAKALESQAKRYTSTTAKPG